MDIKRDEGGLPICPVCGKAIAVAESVIRGGDAMTHVPCAEAERERERANPARTA